jgi:tripartite-type tricarboxylate transporter receptor subunit TctC
MKQWVGFVVGILIPSLIMMAGGLSNPALAQAWPSKPIRVVIAQAPGSATDVISRVVGNQLSESLGQPIVIDARPGAGGALGTEVAARSAPDGYTLFMANNSTMRSGILRRSRSSHRCFTCWWSIRLCRSRRCRSSSRSRNRDPGR